MDNKLDLTVKFLSEGEVSEIVGKKKTTLANERSRGEGIPYFRFGGLVRYSAVDVLDYINGSRVETGRAS